MTMDGHSGGSGGLTVLVIDPDCSRRDHLLRSGTGHAAVAASLCEAFPLAERMMPDLIAISADFLVEPEVEGLVRLAEVLGCRHFFYAEGATDPGGMRGEIVRMQAGDRIEHLVLRAQGGGVSPAVPKADGKPALILIGASTGGVAAIEAVLRGFPVDCPPTVIVQHIREGFVQNLVRRLDACCRPQVIEADHGHRLRRGTVYFASDPNRHLIVTRRGLPRCALVEGPPRNGHRPSVDVLFESAVGWGGPVSAVVLTGMGADGAAGLAALHRCGAHTIAQDKGTSVIWGMPRVAAESGAAREVLPLDRIGGALLHGGAVTRSATSGVAP